MADKKEKIVRLSYSDLIWGFMKCAWYWLTLYWHAVVWNLIQVTSTHQKLTISEMHNRSGEVAVITGGGRGIGLQVVKRLLQAEMHVIIGAVDVVDASRAVSDLKHQIPNGSYEILHLDLAKLKSVRTFARNVLESANVKINKRPITLLINNAGIMFAPYKLTEDGMESHFQVNFHGHFLLTLLLLPALLAAGGRGRPETRARAARIVNVSSNTSYGGNLNFSDLQHRKLYSPYKAYMDSKLAQIVFSNWLANKIEGAEHPPNLTVLAVHPGIALTHLYVHVSYVRFLHAFQPLLRLIWWSADQCADGVAYAALSPEEECKSGRFLFNCRQYEENVLARDPVAQEKLWKMSCALADIDISQDFDLIPQSHNSALKIRKLK